MLEDDENVFFAPFARRVCGVSGGTEHCAELIRRVANRNRATFLQRALRDFGKGHTLADCHIHIHVHIHMFARRLEIHFTSKLTQQLRPHRIQPRIRERFGRNPRRNRVWQKYVVDFVRRLPRQLLKLLVRKLHCHRCLPRVNDQRLQIRQGRKRAAIRNNGTLAARRIAHRKGHHVIERTVSMLSARPFLEHLFQRFVSIWLAVHAVNLCVFRAHATQHAAHFVWRAARRLVRKNQHARAARKRRVELLQHICHALSPAAN
mmetsp:Transcript_1102/g.3130  ORF Transcript_1102/g.3130 Transcript_1102/m.3130 type:complete len:262 (+) Transcript_1102:814-1599(+)